jgi:hypothetical protein
MDVGIKVPDTVLLSINRHYSNLLAESTDIEKENLQGEPWTERKVALRVLIPRGEEAYSVLLLSKYLPN